ncbi:MAG: hypothetical protein IJR59_05145 [Firmicutes bacterium]|nr:hypothetical protein [Bacillota bacterium]
MKKLSFMQKIKEYFKKQDKKMQDIEYVKKLYNRAQGEILAVFIALCALLYFNYNYTVFKLKMSTEYIYTDTLEALSQKHVGKPFSIKNFDGMTIGMYGETLKDEDKYFQLFKSGEFTGELSEMEDIGGDTSVQKSENGCGTINFTLFTPSAFKNVKKQLDTLKTCNTIVIDLRQNTGGMVNTAKKFASLFLDKDDTVYSYATKKKYRTVKNKKDPVLSPDRIIILQDEMTASASELFIMALKENLDNVTVVGTTSYGKGIGQNEYFLADGYAFKFTAIKLFTPSGASINGKGITPDLEYSGDELDNFINTLNTAAK